MRGIVVEEDVHYGVVQQGQPVLNPPLQGNHFSAPRQYTEQLEGSFIDIGDEPLFSAEGLRKEGSAWVKS